MVKRFRHMSIRTRLAFGLLVPIGLAVTALGVAWVPILTGSLNVQAPALMSGMLMFAAIGTGLVMLEINTRALIRPIEEACAATTALLQGRQRRIRIERLDETGELLVALDELGNYLTVRLLDDDDAFPPGKPVLVSSAPATLDTLEQIVEQLREGREEDACDTGPAPLPEPAQPASIRTPQTAQRPRLVSSNPS